MFLYFVLYYFKEDFLRCICFFLLIFQIFVKFFFYVVEMIVNCVNMVMRSFFVNLGL